MKKGTIATIAVIIDVAFANFKAVRNSKTPQIATSMYITEPVYLPASPAYLVKKNAGNITNIIAIAEMYLGKFLDLDICKIIYQNENKKDYQ